MLLLFWTVFASFVTASQTVSTVSACYGESIELPKGHTSHLLFSPRGAGPKRLVFSFGQAKDPRINQVSHTYYLTNVTAADDGNFVILVPGGFTTVLELKVSDCAKKKSKFYMDNLMYDVPVEAQLLEFTPDFDSPKKPIILWNRTDPRSHDKRRGNVRNNVWRMSKLTQADNGYYSFKQKDDTLKSRVHLTVEEKSHHYEAELNNQLLISNPLPGGPWTVTFKPKYGNKQETVLNNGQQAWDNRFYGRMSSYPEGIEIEFIKSEDSGTFKFIDSQGNLALTATLEVDLPDEDRRSNHAVITYALVAVGAVLVGICCCCCCVKCCKKNSSATQTDAGPAGTSHDKTSPEAATGPVVYYHDAPSGPGYPVPAYPSVFPQQPRYQPVNTNPPHINVNPPQPGININPLQVNVDPPQPGININPPQVNLNPPHVSGNPLQPEALPPTDQGSEAAPTFSLDFLPSDNQPRFELKGLSFPSAPPLSSDTPSCDVYNSDKLNFQ